MREIRTSELMEMGIVVNSFIVSSPKPIHNRERVTGQSGFVDLGTDYDGRTIQMKVTILPIDYGDYTLLRNEVFRLFDSRESFYLIHDELGERYLVKCDSDYSFAQIGLIGETKIDFISHSAFVESNGTTLDPFTFDAELWQIGQGLSVDDLHYTHTSTMFNIYNAGDVAVDPRYMELVLEYKGASENLSIKNETTGDEWKFNGSSTSGDAIKIDGVRSTKNGLSIFRDTNRKLITLKPGWNGFRLTGTSGSFEIKFGFRFYYL